MQWFKWLDDFGSFLKWSRRMLAVVLCLWAALALFDLFARLYSTLTSKQRSNPPSDLLMIMAEWNAAVVAILAFGLVAAAAGLFVVPRRRTLPFAWAHFSQAVDYARSRDTDYLTPFNDTGILLRETDVQRRLRMFGSDAAMLDIYAGDSDFLRSDPLQVEELSRLGRDCRLLVNVDIDTPAEELRDLLERGVRVRQYAPGDGPYLLRGRLKMTPGAKSACLFDRVDNQFRVVDIQNSHLLRLVSMDFDRTFQRGRDPFVRIILFDLAGVAFRGDVSSFFSDISDLVGHSVGMQGGDHLLVDRDLNLGVVEIEDVIARRTGLRLTDEQVMQIRDRWLNVWKPQPGMSQLARSLSQAGYVTAICSNCDNLNLDRYRARKSLDPYQHRFMSNEMKLVKPEEAYFNKVCKSLGCEPWQCLLIDDAVENTRAAASIGMKVVLMENKRDPAAWLARRLVELAIAPDRLGGKTL